MKMERWICGNICLVPRSSPQGKLTVNNYQENNGEQITVLPLNRFIVNAAL